MIHLGDITKIKGNEAPTVDCIIGGSPCQDLSLAGKRAGLAGARSGLYMEQIRIIKEMRSYDRANGRTGVDVRPRYMVWENVPGAFSTNKGEDFAAVIEEAIRVAEPEAPSVPVPEKGWPTAGCIVGECWSVAWRVLDAQFWGTSDKPLPQRRRRIALVADFGGLSAPEILFVTKGVSGNIEPGEQKRKETAGDAGESVGGAVGCDNGSVRAYGFDPQACRDVGQYVVEDMANTLTNGTNPGWHNGVCYGIDQQGGKGGANYSVDVMPPMMSDSHGTPHAVCYGIQGSMIGRADQNGPQGDGINEDVSFTLNTADRHAVAYTFEPGIASREGGHVYDDVSGTLRAHAGDNQMAVVHPMKTENSSSFVDVEMEVAVRKYEVDCKKLCQFLHDHKITSKLSNKEIANKLNRPLTMVEHWFRVDNGFAIPDPDVWYDLKNLIGIESTEFDQCITEFEYKSSNYDMRNRIYTGCSSPTLTCGCGDNLHLLPSAYSIENHPADSRVDIDDSGMVQTLTSRMGTGGGNVPMVMESIGFEMQAFGKYKDSGIASSLKARDYKDATDLVVEETVTPCRILNPGDSQGNQVVDGTGSGVYPTLRGCGGAGYQQGYVLASGVDCRNATELPEQNITLQSSCCHNLNSGNVVRVKHIVRRLTPLECERLQGFPDGWTDIGEWVDSKGKKHKEADSPRYKALCNSIALPPWKWVLKRLCACYERDATMASLFDGIGGFPYIWEQLNGKGSCLWASEIEEFPMAVTKVRFGE